VKLKPAPNGSGRADHTPADDRIIVPHALGMGWAINLGAVAVRLGVLQPDDADEETTIDMKGARLWRMLKRLSRTKRQKFEFLPRILVGGVLVGYLKIRMSGWRCGCLRQWSNG